MSDYSGVNIAQHANCVRVRKKAGRVEVRFARQPGTVQTLEGNVPYREGDALLTGLKGEQWPVARERFFANYNALPGLTPGDDGPYEKKPILAYALQCEEESCSIKIHSGATLSGKHGDWVLEYEDGDHGIVAEDLFHDMYEVM